MKLGILSDIHGNHFALQAVLESAEAKGVEQLLIAGDIIGYYFWSKEVLDLLSSWDTVVVRGNHEEMLSQARQNPEILPQIEKKYGIGLSIALDTLLQEQLDWLITLPHPLELTIDGYNILLCHGSPWNINQYIYPDTDSNEIKKMFEMNYDMVILGHTHYSMIKKYGDLIILNPGSVGQPRNRKPGAHWVIFDTKNLQINKYIEDYDIATFIQMVKIQEPHLPYLWEVLARV